MRNYMMYIHSDECAHKNVGIDGETVERFHIVQGQLGAITRLINYFNTNDMDVSFLYKKTMAEYDGGSTHPFIQLVFCNNRDVTLTKDEFFSKYLQIYNQEYPDNRVE